MLMAESNLANALQSLRAHDFSNAGIEVPPGTGWQMTFQPASY
jgi:hypothetical protein